MKVLMKKKKLTDPKLLNSSVQWNDDFLVQETLTDIIKCAKV